MRRETLAPLAADTVAKMLEHTDPLEWFAQWLDEARAHPAVEEPTAVTLATVDEAGRPWARVVLLKQLDEAGFVFYTNLNSPKAEHLQGNRRAALCFHWAPMYRQVRVRGRAELVSSAEADAYFATRDRQSQIGAWASRQSQPMATPEELEECLAFHTQEFLGKDVPRPPQWSGFRVIPESIEFWTQGPFRLHERILYTRSGDAWRVEHLFP